MAADFANPRIQALDNNYIMDKTVNKALTILLVGFEVFFWWEKVLFLAVCSPFLNYGRLAAARYYVRAKHERDYGSMKSLFVLRAVLYFIVFVSLMMGIYNRILDNAEEKRHESPEVIMAVSSWHNHREEYDTFLKSIPYTETQMQKHLNDKHLLDVALATEKKKEQENNAETITKHEQLLKEFWQTLYKCTWSKGVYGCVVGGTQTVKEMMKMDGKQCVAKKSKYSNGFMTSATKLLCLELRKIKLVLPENKTLQQINEKLEAIDYQQVELYWATLQAKKQAKNEAKIKYLGTLNNKDKYEDLDLLFHLMASFIEKILLGYADIGPEHATMALAFVAILGLFKLQDSIEMCAEKSLDPLPRPRQKDEINNNEVGPFGSMIIGFVSWFKSMFTKKVFAPTPAKKSEKPTPANKPAKPTKPMLFVDTEPTKPMLFVDTDLQSTAPTTTPTASTINISQYNEVVYLLKKGKTASKITIETGVNRGTIHKYQVLSNTGGPKS